MSSNNDQPVIPARVRYWVGLEGDSGFEVECTDFSEEAGYMKFMDGPVPVGLVPIQNFRCAHRLEPTVPRRNTAVKV